jgi:hypothetical protein
VVFAEISPGMVIHRALLSRQKLDCLPKPERTFLIVGGHIMNELTVLTRLLLLTIGLLRKASLIEKESAGVQLYVLIRIEIGKLFEAWKCMHRIYFSTVPPKAYEPLIPKEARIALQTLKSYFSSKHFFKDFRNKVSFHYSVDDIEAFLEEIPRSKKLPIIVADMVGTSSYVFCEDIVMSAAFEKIYSGNRNKAVEIMCKEVREVSTAYQTFFNGIMAIILRKYFGGLRAMKARKYSPRFPRDLKRVRIPVFFTNEPG